MKKKLKIAGGIVAVLILVGVAAILYIYNAPRRDIASASPDFTISSDKLMSDWSGDEKAAYTKYNQKVVQVTGVVASKIKDAKLGDVTFALIDENEGIKCTIDSALAVELLGVINIIHPGDDVVIKGKCDGILFDPDMPELGKQVVLSECTIVSDI